MLTIDTFRRVARKRTLLILVVLLLALGVVACNDDKEPESGASAQASAGGIQNAEGEAVAAGQQNLPTPTPYIPQGRLTLWHSWAGPEADALAQILTRVKAEAPLLAVDTLYVAPGDLPQALADAARSGGGPDLAVTENWWISDLAAAGAIRPLDDLAAQGALAQYLPAALSNFQRDGDTYALPATVELVSLFVNSALANPQQAPATTTQLLEQAAISPTLGLGLYANLYHTWWGFPAYGSQLFDETGKVVLDRTSGAADFLTWMQTLAQTPGAFVDTDYGALIDRFKKGEFAYFVDGPWAANELREALGGALTVVPLPAGPIGAAQPWLSAEGVVINAAIADDQVRLAAYLASRLTDAAAGTDFATTGGRLPANAGAALPEDPILRGFMQQAASAQPAPAAREMVQVWGYGGDMLVKVLGGSIAPGEAVRETTALINEETGK